VPVGQSMPAPLLVLHQGITMVLFNHPWSQKRTHASWPLLWCCITSAMDCAVNWRYIPSPEQYGSLVGSDGCWSTFALPGNAPAVASWLPGAVCLCQWVRVAGHLGITRLNRFNRAISPTRCFILTHYSTMHPYCACPLPC
jgi:hypothetical protein